jgi:hypothetical protein
MAAVDAPDSHCTRVLQFPACENMLVKSTNAFCFDDYNTRYRISDPGDYTDQGQREVIIDMAYAPTEGSMRGRILVVAWYDFRLKTIRPEPIDFSSRISLIPRTDLDFPRVPVARSRKHARNLRM